ncbi:MAG: asparaginase domain-containing protein [Bacteroidota bacterium]
MNLTDDDREKIYKACLDTNAEKIIITHGTDTMIDTARKISDIKCKVIILTGAMRPERFSNSDADFNLGVAIGVLNIIKKGVYIAMNGRIFPFDKVKRDVSTGQFVEI